MSTKTVAKADNKGKKQVSNGQLKTTKGTKKS